MTLVLSHVPSVSLTPGEHKFDDMRVSVPCSDLATRTLVVHVPEWSIVAAGVSSAESAVVVGANRVLAASVAAREAGVVSGLRRREAQRRCPHVQVIEHDPGRDARAFETVAAALDAVTPRVEVTRPGTLAFATRGPSRYFGGDDSLAARVVELVTATHLGSGIEARVGVADGSFAALLAALMGIGLLLSLARSLPGAREALAQRTSSLDRTYAAVTSGRSAAGGAGRASGVPRTSGRTPPRASTHGAPLPPAPGASARKAPSTRRAPSARKTSSTRGAPRARRSPKGRR